MNLEEYLPILVFIGAGVLIATVFVGLAFLRGKRTSYPDKITPYECGFDALTEGQIRFDIRYYLVAILFVLFDLEIALLFPWAVTILDLGWEGLANIFCFLFILLIGFIYEWKKGALEWD
jgi:NADH-quinone oxidoreductase subunit A